MFEGVDAAAVAVAPVNSNGVVAHRLHVHHLERGLCTSGKGDGSMGGVCGRRAVRAGADGAGALIAQVAQSVLAVYGRPSSRS